MEVIKIFILPFASSTISMQAALVSFPSRTVLHSKRRLSQAHHQGQGLQGDQLLPGPLHCVKCHLRSLLVLRVLVRVNLSKHCFKRLLFQCNILIKMLHFRLLWQSITFRSILKIMNMFAHHYRHSSKLLFRIVH